LTLAAVDILGGWLNDGLGLVIAGLATYMTN
jgi:hypothetical protein